MRWVGLRVAGAALLLTMAGCQGSAPPPRNPMPTPDSVTRDNPGGDAPDPHKAALIRLLGQPYGKKTDKFKTLDVQFPDVKNWRRVRFFGYPTRAGFRYGNDHYAVAVLVYREAEPDDTPRSCLQHFLRDAKRVAKDFGVRAGTPDWQIEQHRPRLLELDEPSPQGDERPAARQPGRGNEGRGAGTPADATAASDDAAPHAVKSLGPLEKRFRRLRTLTQQKRRGSLPRIGNRRVTRDMPVVYIDGGFVTLADDDRYVAAIAAYHTWPGTCLIHGLAVETGEHEDIARAVLERWIREGASNLVWRESIRERPTFKNR